MATLTARREALADALTAAGLRNVHACAPGSITPPGIVITPAAPWITDTGDVFGGLTARYAIIALHPGSNAVALTALELAVEEVLTVLIGLGAGIEVDEPYIATINATQTYAVTITAELT